MEKKINSINYATLFNNIMGKKCIQFPSFMSEQNLSTSFKTCIYLKENHFHCSLRRPEIHFQHQQGYQWANAKWGTTINLQRTTTALDLVEHLKRVDIEKKTWKRNKWFSEVINKRFRHQLKQKQIWRRINKGIKIRLHWQRWSYGFVKYYV